MSQVEVALVGRRLTPVAWRELTPEWYDGYYEGEDVLTWDVRPRVSLSVTDDETLREIAIRAVEAFGIWENDWDDAGFGGTPSDHEWPGTRRFIALRSETSPIPVSERLSVGLTMVNEEGLAEWGRPYQLVTYGELSRAAAAGAVKGDPKQIYLSVRPDAAGGAIGHEWALLLQVWDVAWKVVVGLVAANELHDLYAKLKSRLAGREIVERKTQDWIRRNGHADDLAYMLRGEPWSPFQLAGLLGCTTDEAEDVLALFGYERGEDQNVWNYAGGDEALGLPVKDVSAHSLVAFTKEVQRRYTDDTEAPSEEVEALFREIVRQAERGRVGDLSHIPYGDGFGWDPPPRRWRLMAAIRRRFHRGGNT